MPDTHGADEAVVMQNSSSSETEARNSAATSAGPQLWSKRRLIAIATSCAVVAVVLCAFVAWMVHAARDEMVRREQADKAHKAAEAERKAKEEQARVEQAAAEQKAHEEAERKEREEKDRLEKEAKEKRDREDAANRPSLSSKDIKDRIAIIECKEGSGIGCLLEMEGKTYLVSNEHVLRSSSAPKATMPNGEQLSLGEFSVATDRDLARFEVLGCNVKPLVATDDEPNANDVVTVCGNSLGGGVVTESRGFIQGVGPAKLETNAEIVPGNSGSPLVSKDGCVVGVATLIDRSGTKDWTSHNTRYENSPRRFASRLKNVQWKTVDRRTYESQAGDYAEFKTFWGYLIPYIFVESRRDESSSLRFSDYNRREFSRGLGFDDVLMNLSKSYEKKNDLLERYVQRDKNRNVFIQRLIDRQVSRDEGEREIRKYDKKTEVAYEEAKRALRDFVLAREKALGAARRFLVGRTWVAPQFESGHGCDESEVCVKLYKDWIAECEALMKQTMLDLNDMIKKIERSKDDY